MSSNNLQRRNSEEISRTITNMKGIFSNRDITMEKIKFIGFDMDYTLAEYISPGYEKLTLKYATQQLITMGYPSELTNAEYQQSFPSRGIVYDRKYGNFLKIDPFGNIMKTVYGLKPLDQEKSRELYKNRFIDMENRQRFANFYTLFELPSVFLISSIIETFENNNDWVRNETGSGFVNGSICLTYNNIYEDVSNVFTNVHTNSDMKKETLDNVSMYIKKDDRLPILLKRIRDLGRKTMLVTNSNYWYTDGILKYLLGDSKKIDEVYSNDWRDYFDLVIVDACKPKFFAEGNSICAIDVKTGKKSIGIYKGAISSQTVYSGGNSEIFCQHLGCVGKEILFVGDHIFGDILKSKKKQGWRTFLVIPELMDEVRMWIRLRDKYKLTDEKYTEIIQKFQNTDPSLSTLPELLDEKLENLKALSKEIDDSYGMFGSLFRCGSRPSYFANQITRYADLYSHSVINMLNYPIFYFFSSPISLMPHEVATDAEEKTKKDLRN